VPSKNLRNNELEFTPTFGTQHSTNKIKGEDMFLHKLMNLSGIVILCSCILTGCSDLVDNSELSDIKQVPYTLTAHEYIMKEYFSRYSRDHYKDVLLQNESYFLKDGKFDAELSTEFVIENLYLFADSLLYETIVNEAIEIFSIENVDDYTIAFTEDAKKYLLDYKNEYSGINAFQFRRADNYAMLYSYATSNIDDLSDYEKEHYVALFDMIEDNNSLESIIQYLNDTMKDQNFSSDYAEIVQFAYNTSRFYATEGANLYGITGGFGYFAGLWALGYGIGWDIGGLTHGRNLGDAAFGSITQCSVIGIIGAMDEYIDSFTFDIDSM
jgi:hypothetical protein